MSLLYFISLKVENIFLRFIVIGQVLGGFSHLCGGDKMDRLTLSDKILSLFGLSGALFTIKSWSDPYYAFLSHKHSIWELSLYYFE